jgi:hypothetical protein
MVEAGESRHHHCAEARKSLIFIGNKNLQNRKNRDFGWKPVEKPVEFFRHRKRPYAVSDEGPG